MGKLSTVAVAELQAAHERISTGKVAKRLMVALAYKDGVAIETLSKRYAIPRSTVYYWLDWIKELPTRKPSTMPIILADRQSRRPPRSNSRLS